VKQTETDPGLIGVSNTFKIGSIINYTWKKCIVAENVKGY